MLVLGLQMTDNEFLMIAASAERSSQHPIAHAITTFAEKRGLALVDPTVSATPCLLLHCQVLVA